MRLTGSDKLKIVKEYFDEHSSITSLCRKTGKNKGDVQYWIRLYELHGEAPFSDCQADRLYTREEKLKAISS